MNEISFVAKFHAENGYSFYLPTKIVKWLSLEFSTYNNTVYIKQSPDSKEIKVDCTATRHRETWKFAFYQWDYQRNENGKDLKPKTDYLFRIPISSG